MCGIAGFVDYNNVSTVETIKDMINSQTHRGPDAEGYVFEKIGNITVALGHKRLSIIDFTESANQPMQFAHLTIVYNGEVYNAAEIKKELQNENYIFETSSDTEVVLKAFHKWGVAAVDKFRGMFAFCVLNKMTMKAYLFRDRVGAKPLYYYFDENTLLFSSKARSFQFYPGFKSRICDIGLQLYLQNGYIPAPWTIYQGARKVRPGHFVEFNIIDNKLTEEQYWSLSPFFFKQKMQGDEAEITEQLHQMLTESFLLRMVSDVPVGVLLSGGIDSTLITTLLQSNLTKPIDTFTIGFDNVNYDESSYARKIAGHLGTQHNETMCTSKEAGHLIPLIPKIYDEPFADPSAIPTVLVSEFVKKKVAVVLSGDGGDEMFCGYNSYYINESRLKKINKIPFKKHIRKFLDYLPDPMINMFHFHYDYYDRYLKLKTILNNDSIEDQFESLTHTFTNYDLKHLLINKKIHSFNRDIHDLPTVEKMMLMDFNQYLSDNLMVKIDRATMYYSLEGREPLLDHKILEFAAQLPLPFKLNKFILKKILSKYLPSEYFDRKKQGFGAPINQWLRNELNYLLEKYLSPDKLIKQGIFNHQYVSGLCKAFMRSKTDNLRIWTLLVFQMWYEEHFNETF